MKIQFVRLDLDVCEVVNELAGQQRRTVTDVVNQLLREQLVQAGELPAEGAASR